MPIRPCKSLQRPNDMKMVDKFSPIYSVEFLVLQYKDPHITEQAFSTKFPKDRKHPCKVLQVVV